MITRTKIEDDMIRHDVTMAIYLCVFAIFIRCAPLLLLAQYLPTTIYYD